MTEVGMSSSAHSVMSGCTGHCLQEVRSLNCSMIELPHYGCNHPPRLLLLDHQVAVWCRCRQRWAPHKLLVLWCLLGCARCSQRQWSVLTETDRRRTRRRMRTQGWTRLLRNGTRWTSPSLYSTWQPGTFLPFISSTIVGWPWLTIS